MPISRKTSRPTFTRPGTFTRRSGVALALISALAYSTAGLFTKGVSADAWSVIFWRGFFAAAFTGFYVLWNGYSVREFRHMGTAGWVVALIGASGTAAFIPAFKLTTIANVSLIYATAPFVAAAIAWIWFRERPTLIVMLASTIALIGMIIIVGGSYGGVYSRGDFLALWMTLMMSIAMVIYRRYPETPAAGPMVMSSLFLLPLALHYSDPLSAPIGEIVVMAAFGLIFAVASVTLLEGARRLSPSEVALLSALETPLAPIWAWFLFAEMPTNSAMVGGTVILVAVFGSQIANLTSRS